MCALGVGFASFGATTWIDLGEAELMDGWLLPGLGINQNNPKNWYKVPVQKDSEKPVYRLVDPYHIGPAAQYNECEEPGYIVLDATDPEHVIVNPDKVSAGFANESMEIGEFYCYNMLGFACAYFKEYTPQEIIEKVGDGYPYTTFKDNVFVLSYIMEDNQRLYDANYGNEYNPSGGFHWWVSPNSSVSKDMNCRIVLPAESGVSYVEDDNRNCKAEYYDLNGVRVDNPESGLYLRRQGTKVTKILF